MGFPLSTPCRLHLPGGLQPVPLLLPLHLHEGGLQVLGHRVQLGDELLLALPLLLPGQLHLGAGALNLVYFL